MKPHTNDSRSAPNFSSTFKYNSKYGSRVVEKRITARSRTIRLVYRIGERSRFVPRLSVGSFARSTWIRVAHNIKITKQPQRAPTDVERNNDSDFGRVVARQNNRIVRARRTEIHCLTVNRFGFSAVGLLWPLSWPVCIRQK